jgi:hypothetical protein
MPSSWEEAKSHPRSDERGSGHDDQPTAIAPASSSTMGEWTDRGDLEDAGTERCRCSRKGQAPEARADARFEVVDHEVASVPAPSTSRDRIWPMAR